MSEVAEEVEVSGIVIEDQLLDHLATPEGAMSIWRERLEPAIVGDDEDVRKVLIWTTNYIDEHREAPTKELLKYEFGLDFLEPVAPLDYVLDKFRERYRRKQAQRAISKVAKIVNSDPEEAVALAFSEFARIRAETVSRETMRDSQDIGSRVDAYNERVLTGNTAGVTFGWPQIDEILGGLRLGCLYFVLARPKRYKSWFVLKSAHEAWKGGEDVDFNTLELPITEMQDRWLCMLAGVSYGAFMHHRLTHQDLQHLDWARNYAAEQNNKIRFLQPPRGERTVGHLLQTATETDRPPAVIYIDQLSFLESTRKTAIDQRWREVEFICEDLAEAKNQFPIYVAAQFNREAASLNEMADLAQIGLSDAIGQKADMVLGLYASKDMIANKVIEFGTVAARSFEHARFEMKTGLEGDDYIKFLTVKAEE